MSTRIDFLTWLSKVRAAIDIVTITIAVDTGAMRQSIRDVLYRQAQRRVPFSLSIAVLNSLDPKVPYHTRQHPLFNFPSGYNDKSKQPIDTVAILLGLEAALNRWVVV